MITAQHLTARVRHELVRRHVRVLSAESVTPRMRRIVFAGESLQSFVSAAHDDHVKIFFPATEPAGEPTAIARDFTPRRFDAERGELTIDFALHDAGIATTWARQAKPGDALEIGGPRGSHVVADDFDWYLLIGDETALPAIGRRLEELRRGASVTTIIAIADEQEEQRLTTAAAWVPIWLHRDASTESDEQRIRHVLDALTFPAGDGHVWLAGESAMVRALRSHLIDDRNHPAEWIRAAGYWKRGAPGAHDHF